MFFMQVSAIIDEMRALDPALPKVFLKINNRKNAYPGAAYRKEYKIVIARYMENCSKDLLYHVVVHELIHTWFRVGHFRSCPLMTSRVNVDKPVPKEQVNAIFKEYFNKYKGNLNVQPRL